MARKRFWDLYDDCPALEPTVPEIPFDDLDPHSKRLWLACDSARFEITPEMVRRSRRAYFANISYVDEKVGELLDVLARTRMLEDTVVVFVSDHGDMLGERGLWFKMSFFEGSCRVPLMIAAPGMAPGAIATPSPPSTCCRRWLNSPGSRWRASPPGPMGKASSVLRTALAAPPRWRWNTPRRER